MSHGAPDLVAAVCALAVVAGHAPTCSPVPAFPVQLVAVLGGVGLVAVAISAHPGTHAVMPVLVAVYWRWPRPRCGTLAALVLTVRGRSGWASGLPRFSELAVVGGSRAGADRCGVGGHRTRVGAGAGHHRLRPVVVGKSAGLVALVALAARHPRPAGCPTRPGTEARRPSPPPCRGATRGDGGGPGPRGGVVGHSPLEIGLLTSCWAVRRPRRR